MIRTDIDCVCDAAQVGGVDAWSIVGDSWGLTISRTIVADSESDNREDYQRHADPTNCVLAKGSHDRPKARKRNCNPDWCAISNYSGVNLGRAIETDPIPESSKSLALRDGSVTRSEWQSGPNNVLLTDEAGQYSSSVTVTESDVGWILPYECGMPSSLGIRRNNARKSPCPT
jgi:hypothetical protein